MQNPNEEGASYGLSLLSALYPSATPVTHTTYKPQAKQSCPVFPEAPLAVEADEEDVREPASNVLSEDAIKDLAKRYLAVITPGGLQAVTRQQFDQVLGFYGASADRALRFKSLVEDLEAGK